MPLPSGTHSLKYRVTDAVGNKIGEGTTSVDPGGEFSLAFDLPKNANLGAAGVAFELSRASVIMGTTVLFRDGQPHDEAAPEAAAYLKHNDILLSVDLGAGSAASTVWTCDLSAEYVRINAEYRT